MHRVCGEQGNVGVKRKSLELSWRQPFYLNIRKHNGRILTFVLYPDRGKGLRKNEANVLRLILNFLIIKMEPLYLSHRAFEKVT